MFSEKYKTKWHDTDASRRVTATKMLVLMQETSNHHLESAGPSLDKLRDERGLAFLLSKIRMRIYKPLYAAEDIEVQTWTYASRGYSFPRCYRIVRGEEIIAEADTVWALVDISSRALIKAADCDAYEFEDQAPSELDLPTRFRLPVGLELVSIGERRIVWSDLDYNMHMNNNGYFVVHLSNGNAKLFYVHRLVALAFIPNPDALPQINHKNEIKTDNRAENLEWCTSHYNTNYGTRNKRIQRNRSFPVAQLDVNGKIVNAFYGISEAQRITGIDRPNICKCLKGKTKTAGGYKWKYVL